MLGDGTANDYPAPTDRVVSALAALPPDLSGRTILVLGNEREMLEGFTFALRAVGARVATAFDTLEAVRRIGTSPIDFVVSDVVASGDGSGSLIRLICLTPSSPKRGGGGADERPEELRLRALVTGRVAHVAKPVDLRALIGMVDRMLREQAQSSLD